ncbi:DUF2786 domain-containing protein [Amycolatopsis suaedae]|uniref:DUF2786 domain-containing protein n=1 Tax=Amycolatopsis suaedae TaxID=2510978 RepID=UPI001F108EFF|nr:DUF2786 domain-containing protein [Amycolatopsis suaedae]
MPKNTELLDKVRKLLAKAENPAVTEAEAEAYNAKAAELIARYGIDRAVLAATGGDPDEIVGLTINLENPYSRDKAYLVGCVADPLRCRVVLTLVGQRVKSVTVFGFRSDAERVELLFTSLLLQASTQLTRVRPDCLTGRRQSVAAYRRTWLSGFGNAVRQRLLEAEMRAAREYDAASNGGPSTELVLRDRELMLDEAYQAEFGQVKFATPRQLSGTGYGDGLVAGKAADLDGVGLRDGASRDALPVR